MEISSDEEALSHNNRNYCEYCMVCGEHATEPPWFEASTDRLSDPERIDMMIQLRMPDLAEPEIKKARELVLRLAWFSNQPAKAGASTLPPEDNSEATAKSSNALPGIWAEPSEPPRAVERRVLPTEPETRRVKARGRPWPDTLGVQQRSTQQLEGARALTPLSEGVAAQAVFTSPVKTPPGWTPPNSPTDSENWGGWKPAQAGRGDLQPKTPPKSVDPKGLGSMMPKTPPKTAPLEAPAEEEVLYYSSACACFCDWSDVPTRRDEWTRINPEPLTISIAQALAERYEGHSESFAPERHAPVAERAVRTLKGIVSSHELQLRENGVVLGDDPGTLEFLFRYAAHVHNRFAVSVGNTMSPLQKLRGHDHKPQLTYPFGAVVFAKVSRSSKEEVDTKYARGVYLGPVLGSTGHQVRIRLDSGETKLIVAPGLKLLYPLRNDASLLDGARPLEGFVPPLDEERFRELHLPYVPGGGPSKEWIREHGGTPKCPGCSEEATSSRHSIKCVRRYQRWLRDAVDNALEELGRDPPPAQGPPAKRVRFGDSEVREFPAPSAPSHQEVEVPQISAEANDHLSDYEPSLPSEDEGEDDLMGVAEAPKDDRPAIRLLEEMWACGCVRYVPTPLTACDVYDLQAFCSLLVDGRSSCDKLPYSCIALLEHERVEHDVGRPRSSYDDVDGIQLDNKESWEGMKTEVKAVDSLQVGLLRSRSEVDRYQEENPGHLGKIMVGLGLKASPLEPTLFSGWVQLGKKWTYIIALAYVDDLLIVSDSQEGVEFIHKSLSAVLKVKVTGRLHEDGQLEFLGRLIKLDGNNITLGVKPEYVRSVFSAFGWTEKDLAKVKPVQVLPWEDWLVDPVFPAGSGETLEEEGATLVAFCDSQLASHIWGQIAKPLAIYTDSASARQIAGMEGFLRRMRHVDIRLCFIQDRVHQNELVINGVAGEENVSDLLTKNLNRPQTLKHTTTLGLEDVHQVDLCAVPVVRSCVFLTGLLNSIFDNTELEWERFLGLCELPTSYGTLFIEFCTDPQSSFVTTGCDYSVFVLPVTVEVDGTSPETELGNEGCSLEQHALYRG
ncbi:GIP [Symbiodinium sp. CCMP2592]|nr:GIP [Symbiodinium sp. CCMP2592]